MSDYLFINRRLDGTGGSKVIIDLCNELVMKGHNASILVDEQSNCSFDINENVNIFKWGVFSIKEIEVNDEIASVDKKNKRKNAIYLFSIIKEYIYFLLLPFFLYSFFVFYKKSNYKYIINSNVYNYNERHYFLNLIFDKYFVNFHNSLNDLITRKKKLSILPIRFIFKELHILCVSKGIANEIMSYKLSKFNPEVIYNIFDFIIINKLSLSSIDNCDFDFILSIGTLSKRKNFSLGIDVFYELSKKNKDLHYIILGDGGLKDELLRKISTLNLLDKIHILGFDKNPYRYIKRSKCLVLTSLSEGLPTVLVESLILGTPVVSTNCPTGPDEILYKCRNLSLVDINENMTCIFERKIQNFLDLNYTADDIKKLSDIERFNPSNILIKWEKL